MQPAPSRPTDLATAVGISISYASEILDGKRDPSRSLAIHILRKIEWRHKVLDGLTDDEIDFLERLHPYTPASKAA